MPRHQDHQHVKVTFDAETDAYCPTCGYNLRGASGSHCPECGSGFALTIPKRNSRYALYLLGLISTAYLSLSTNVLIFFLILYFGSKWSYGFLTFEYACHVLAVPYMALLIRYRRQIVRATIGIQLIWAAPPVLATSFLFARSLYRAVFFY